MTTAELILVAKPEHCAKCGHGSAGIYRDEMIEEWACRLCGWNCGSKPSVAVTLDSRWDWLLEVRTSSVN